MRYLFHFVSLLTLGSLGFQAPCAAAGSPILTEYKRFYREIDVKWDATGPNVIELAEAGNPIICPR